MNTPITPLPGNTYAEDFRTDESVPAGGVNPDDPPWGVWSAAFVWLSSLLLMVFIPLAAIIPYTFYRYSGADFRRINELLLGDPNILLITLLATLPAHLVTLGIIWAVVTRLGKRPFWSAIGWSWPPDFGLWKSVLAAIALLGGALGVAYLLGVEKTPFDEMLESSTGARFATAFLATATAPLVEELVYRGVAYPALRRGIAWAIESLKSFASLLEGGAYGQDSPGDPVARVAAIVWKLLGRFFYSVLTFFGTFGPREGGTVWAVIVVGGLFALVHVSQYKNSPGTIGAIVLLSYALTIIRARTGRVLPCFVIHLIFNGLQVAGLIAEHFQPGKPAGEAPQQQAALFTLAAHAFGLTL